MKVMIQWVFFNAVIPLIPVAVVWLFSWLLSDKHTTPPRQTQTVFSIIKDGQVFFYCTALTSVAIGDLGKVPAGFDIVPWVSGFLFIMIMSTAFFALAVNSKGQLAEIKFGWLSVTTAIAAIVLVMMFRRQSGLL